jgi:hypothetical protein
MAKILLRIAPAEGQETVEVEGFFVPGTDNKFAVHVNADGDLFNLTHVPTGMASVQDVTKTEALWLARQLFAACPHAWSLEDGDAVLEALPFWVRKWAATIRCVAEEGGYIYLLKSCADFVREMEALDNKQEKGDQECPQ